MFNDIQDMPPEMAKVAMATQAMRGRNAEIANQIEHLGGGFDLSTAVLEHFKTCLVEAGVITEQQMWEMNLDWEKTLRPQLRNILNRMKDIHRQGQAAQKNQIARPINGGKIWTPGDPA